MVYVGSSMYPALKAPDVIYFRPYAGRRVRIGDIVVFNRPELGKSITHRVVAISAAGIVTRGDNNRKRDPWVLRPADLDGRVVCARQNRRYRRIRGGWAGLAGAEAGRLIRRLARPWMAWLANARRRMRRA